MHLGTLRQRDLRGDVRTAAEPVDAQPSAGGQLGPHQRAIADDAGAQQRRQLDVGVSRRQPVRESGWDGGEFGVAAVGVPAGVAGLGTEILLPAHTELALPAGMPQPRDTDTIADLELAAGARALRDDLANDLVSGRDGGPVHRQVAFGDVQVGAAHAAGVHGDKQLAVTGPGHFDGYALQRLGVHRAGPTDLPRLHRLGGHATMVARRRDARRRSRNALKAAA